MTQFFVLGPEGTFSSMTLLKLTAFQPFDAVLVKTIPEVFNNVVHTNGSYGVVPVENLSTGNIGITLSSLQVSSVSIVAELFMEIRFAVIYGGSPNAVERLYAFHESYEQCSTFAFDRLLNANRIDTNSNIDSFRQFKKDAQPEKSAAIIPLPYFEKQRLDAAYVFEKNIQNSANNFTRFIVIKKKTGGQWDFNNHKTSIFIDTFEDKASLLYYILKEFHERGINLDSLHSKPSKKYPGNYSFFIDFINNNTNAVSDCLSALKNLKVEFNILGTYNKTP